MNTWFSTFRSLANSNQRPFRDWWPLYTTRSQRQALLRLLAVASEQRLPLAPLISAWAIDERGVQERRLRRLGRLLAEGVPLANAIEEAPAGLTEDDVLAIRFGAQSGTLSAALRSAIDKPGSSAADWRTSLSGTFTYLCTVAVVACAIVTFLQLKIVPVLQRIHAEFGIEPPAAFRQSQEMANFAAHFWWVGAILLLALLWSAFSASPGRFIRHALGKIFWPLQQLRAADVLQKLSIAVSAGRPISGALSTLARYHFDPRIRHKLLFVRNELEHGADVWQSMAAIRLMTQPEVDLMKSAERAGNQSWALEQLAAGKNRRTQRRVERLSELVLPLAVMLLGAFVLFQALTIFLPLIKLLIAQV